jgi:hypothetical protein
MTEYEALKSEIEVLQREARRSDGEGDYTPPGIRSVPLQ